MKWMLIAVPAFFYSGWWAQKVFAYQPVFATVAVEAPEVVAPVLENGHLFTFMFVGVLGGAYICWVMRLENDNEFAKQTVRRRALYGLTAFVYGMLSTPVILERVVVGETAAMCLGVGALNAFCAWVVLELFYTRARKIVVGWFDKFFPPGPKE